MPEDRKALKEAAIGAQGRWSERPLSEATLYEFDIPATILAYEAALDVAEQRERRLREALDGLVGAISVTTGQAGRRSWSVNPTKLPRAYDTARAALSEEGA